MQDLVLATGNLGKVVELQAMLDSVGYRVRPQSEFDVSEADEIGLTFVENALIKARNAAVHTGLPVLADDSGLCVDYLQGAPGIYSSRYSGVGATDTANVDKLLLALADVPDKERGAHFHCSVVYLRHADDPDPLICIARWYGIIARTVSGENGFGYDPVFYVPTLGCSSAELEKAEKNRLSHRGQALAAFRAAIA